MPPPPQEQHYNIDKLHVIFACVAIVLLTALLCMFGRDYSKMWKEYQSRFRGLEIEKARIKQDSEDISLSQNEEYQELLKQIATSQQNLKSKSSDIAKINKAIATIQASINITTQQSQFRKAELDALNVERAKQGLPPLTELPPTPPPKKSFMEEHRTAILWIIIVLVIIGASLFIYSDFKEKQKIIYQHSLINHKI